MQILSQAYSRRLRMDMNRHRNEFGPADLLGFLEAKPSPIPAYPISKR
jgi:hypothetical protein